jgi:uncharacterized protein (TIGR02679 family)
MKRAPGGTTSRRDDASDGQLDTGRLGRLLGSPELEWLIARLRRRLEAGQALEGTVTLAQPSAAQRQAVSRLLGHPPRAGRALGVPLDAVDSVLRRSGVSLDGLAAAVIALTGPVVVSKDARAAELLAWQAAFASLTDAVNRRPERISGERARLFAWLERLRRLGTVKRLEPDPHAARALLDALAGVIAVLPVEGEPLGHFAARVAGGAHALDDGRPLGTLALSAARALGGLRGPAQGESRAEARREVWAAVGVMCDAVSSVVLTLALPGDRRTGTGLILQAAREGGEPVWLTLRQLMGDPPAWMAGGGAHPIARTVHICENPTVVTVAAERLGGRCAPLVCTNGQPGAATMVLLRSISAAGARLVHHGDFDWGGVRIGNVLHARLSVSPWRFDAQTYLRAVEGTPSVQRLRGREAAASWDPALTDAMRRVGRRVEEESVVEELLVDLEA